MATNGVEQTVQPSLPTLDKLGVNLSDDIDAKSTVLTWLSNFDKRLQAKDALGITQLLLEDGLWRDILALTWDFRTFVGAKKIHRFLEDILNDVQLSNLELVSDQVQLQRPYPDLVWIQGVFKFQTGVGEGNGVFRIVPTASGEWKAHVISTELIGLKGYPELIGPLRDDKPNHGTWPDKRRKEVEFEDSEPTVVIIGGGQSGLEIAARLKMLGVQALVIEKQPRIGDQWRTRYEALCLHDPVCKY